MDSLENKGNLEQPKEQQQQEQPNEQKIEMDIDQLKLWMVTDEGKKFMQPLLDRHFTKGLETWKKNNLDALVQEKYNELHPTDPKEQEILRLKKELAQKQIQEETIKMLEEADIPVSFCDYFKSEDLETTKTTITTFVEQFNKAVNKEVTNRLKGWGGTPKNFSRQHPSITKDDLKSMSYEQRVQLYNSGYQHLFK